QEALDLLKQQDFDIVLMDLQMPVMDGISAVKAIRANPGYNQLPVLALTANAMAGDRQRSLAAGMDDHITKPFDPNELLETLSKWIKPKAGKRSEAHPS
ncbi:response regulator, partial [Porticoccus sp.]